MANAKDLVALHGLYRDGGADPGRVRRRSPQSRRATALPGCVRSTESCRRSSALAALAVVAAATRRRSLGLPTSGRDRVTSRARATGRWVQEVPGAGCGRCG